MKFDLLELTEALHGGKRISLEGINEGTYREVISMLRFKIFLPLKGYSYREDIEQGKWLGIKKMGEHQNCVPCLRPDERGLHIKDFIIDSNPVKKSMIDLLKSCITMIESDDIRNLTDLRTVLFGDEEL